MVLLPQSYYEGTLLQEDISDPCRINETGHELCQFFQYPALPDEAITVRGENGYIVDGDERKPTNLFDDAEVLGVS